MNEGLVSYEIKKKQENLKTSRNYGFMLSLPPKLKIFSILQKKKKTIEK